MKFPAILTFSLAIGLLSCNSKPKKTTPEKANSHESEAPAVYKSSLAEAREKFKTKLVKHNQMKEKPATPPKELFSAVSFPTKIGNMDAYLGKIPDDGKLHPAMIWLTGGMGNGIDEVWEEADADNDQTASVFRKAGLVMMYPTQRGGGMSPGYEESFYGEIDDIIAARDFLAKQKGVDPARIYLGGHSTGGTKALLVAESTDKFKAVFSFGPVSSVLLYGSDDLTYDTKSKTENILRAPGAWLSDIVTPTYVFEGNAGMSNVSELQFLKGLAEKSELQSIHFYEIKGKDHFSGLQPASKIVAKKIMADSLSFDDPLFK
jgi:alpha/beta superfamily hydrolase